MSPIIVPPRWKIPEREATPESVYLRRREFLKALGLGGAAAGLFLAGCGPGDGSGAEKLPPSPIDPTGRTPARRNPRYTLDRPLTEEVVAARYNNFYEFSTQKEKVATLAKGFRMRPWTLEVTGLVSKPARFDVDDLVRKMPIEERLYRHRCVEAWAMAVPWTGFPLSALLKRVEPRAEARFVRFVSFDKPRTEGMKETASWIPWPYHEGLTIEEATCDLTLLVTGIYGHPLPPQHGGPIRLVTPWKYGYKSAKSIVRIELAATRPPTLWNQVAPDEYDFFANVNPAKPHPRWSQATERMIGTGEQRPTRLYNGYAEFVAGLYGKG